jgi:hypothetical protein
LAAVGRALIVLKWSEARTVHKDKWLLFEAINAYSRDGQRIVEEISIFNAFDDGKVTLAEYAAQHKREVRTENSMFTIPLMRNASGSESEHMVRLEFKYGFPFCQVALDQRKSLELDVVLVDTGSGGTVFKMDKVDELDITIEPDDVIETISGVGGSEFVYKKTVEELKLGEAEVSGFPIEVGVMDYGFAIIGVLGMEFLREIGAKIDHVRMEVTTTR